MSDPVEDLLVRTLRDPGRALPPPPDPVPAIRQRVRTQRRNTALGLAAVVLVVAATVLAPATIGRFTRPAPTAATGGDLLPWAPRGGLRDDADLIRAAERVWRSGPGPRPTGPARTLWAGRLGASRVVLLQARTASGPAVAQLTDRDGTLRLVAADPLPAPEPAVLRLVDATPAELQTLLLAAPGAVSVEVYDLFVPVSGAQGDLGDDDLVRVDKGAAKSGLAVALGGRGEVVSSGMLPTTGHLPTTRGAVTVVAPDWDPRWNGPMVSSTVSDAVLLAERLGGGPIEVAQLSGNSTGFELSGDLAAYPRFYEVHQGGTRYLASLVAVSVLVPERTYCLRLEPFTGAGPDAVVLRCPLPGYAAGALSVLARHGVRSGTLILGSQRHRLSFEQTGGISMEKTGPDFPAGAGRLELLDDEGRALPTIQLPAYKP